MTDHFSGIVRVQTLDWCLEIGVTKAKEKAVTRSTSYSAGILSHHPPPPYCFFFLFSVFRWGKGDCDSPCHPPTDEREEEATASHGDTSRVPRGTISANHFPLLHFLRHHNLLGVRSSFPVPPRFSPMGGDGLHSALPPIWEMVVVGTAATTTTTTSDRWDCSLHQCPSPR